jgi:hypothetical protein
MITNTPLILIKHLEFAPERTIALGILTDPMRSIDFLLREWPGWIASKVKIPVQCKLVSVTTRTSGYSEEGEVVICHDDRQHISDLKSSITAAAENLIEFEIEGDLVSFMPRSLEASEGSIFLAGHPEIDPHVSEVKLDVQIECLASLPDISGFLLLLHQLEVGTTVPENLRYSKEFSDAARNMKPIEGMFIPVEVSIENDIVRGAIRLGTPISNLFVCATLFLAKKVGRLRHGTVLRRRVQWQHAGIVEERVVVVGEICEGETIKLC